MRVEDQDGFLCGMCLDLTLYLPEAPTADETRAAVAAYLAMCPPQRATMLSSPKEEWDDLQRPVNASDLAPFWSRIDQRIDEGIAIWDGVPDGWSFLMRGIPPQPGPAAEDAAGDEGVDEQQTVTTDDDEGYTEDEESPPERFTDVASLCQLQVPDSEPAVLLELARQLADITPFVSGHGGYSVSYNPWRKDEAFDCIYAWAKRYLGIDVNDLNKTLMLALSAAKSVNWLTLVGTELWQLLRQTRGGQVPHFPQDIVVEPRAHGVLIRAGDHPVMADRNRREYPQLYAIVERELLPILLSQHEEFPGRFAETGSTMAWLRRLSNPAGW